LLRHIIHLHIPAFAIAVARVCEPGLRERPVALAPLHSERALILSSSYEARREGVYRGMPLRKAIRFCPDLRVIPPDLGLTERAWRELIRVATQYTPLWEPFRPGHVYLDMTGTERLWGRAKDAASRFRREIKKRLQLPGTVGVAGNKMVSSIASRILRAEGVLDVDHGREPLFMAPLKVDMLPGIGHVRRRILLEELNITLVREIAAMDMGSLRIVFGKEAYMIRQRAVGIDPTPVCPPRAKPVVSEEVVLAGDENDDEKLLSALYGLVEKCASKLRARSLAPRRAGLIIRYADQEEVTRRINLPRPSFWDFELYRSMERLFLKACRRRVRVRFMKVWFRDFSAPDPQLTLFAAAPHDREKKAGAILALDRIRERYGGEAIKYGRTVRICSP